MAMEAQHMKIECCVEPVMKRGSSFGCSVEPSFQHYLGHTSEWLFGHSKWTFLREFRYRVELAYKQSLDGCVAARAIWQ